MHFFAPLLPNLLVKTIADFSPQSATRGEATTIKKYKRNALQAPRLADERTTAEIYLRDATSPPPPYRRPTNRPSTNIVHPRPSSTTPSPSPSRSPSLTQQQQQHQYQQHHHQQHQQQQSESMLGDERRIDGVRHVLTAQGIEQEQEQNRPLEQENTSHVGVTICVARA
uniref:Uncharacterized protein n=1 Tax=Globodera rostochiensis TaxID=31243 RepID=A0A914H993_GLORO